MGLLECAGHKLKAVLANRREYCSLMCEVQMQNLTRALKTRADVKAAAQGREESEDSEVRRRCRLGQSHDTPTNQSALFDTLLTKKTSICAPEKRKECKEVPKKWLIIKFYQKKARTEKMRQTAETVTTSERGKLLSNQKGARHLIHVNLHLSARELRLAVGSHKALAAGEVKGWCMGSGSSYLSVVLSVTLGAVFVVTDKVTVGVAAAIVKKSSGYVLIEKAPFSFSRICVRSLPPNLQTDDLQGIHKDRTQVGASLAGADGTDGLVRFDSVGGLSEHISALKEMVVFPLLYPEFFEGFKIQPPRGCIFYGPPGTGKTLVAQALANECRQGDRKIAFFMRSGADCLSKWVGESEQQLRSLFDQAYQMRPSIIFLDEIDGLAPERSSKQDQVYSSIVTTLLTLMDGLNGRGEVVVIGATNRLDSIDPALRRPGRFDREFLFSLPNREARKEIFKIHTRDWSPQPLDSFLDELAAKCVGYCGADIKSLCAEAALCALRRHYPQIYQSTEKLRLNMASIKITAQDFVTAMQKIVPASQRVVSSPGRPLTPMLKPLLGNTLARILRALQRAFPHAELALRNREQESCTNLSAVMTVESCNSPVPSAGMSGLQYKSKGFKLNPGSALGIFNGSLLTYMFVGRTARLHVRCLETTDTLPDPLLLRKKKPEVFPNRGPSSVMQEEKDLLSICEEGTRQKMPAGPKKEFLDFSRNAYYQPTSYKPRFLVAGEPGCGQTSDLAPAVLHALEKFPVHTLDLPRLLGNIASPAERCVQAVACGLPLHVLWSDGSFGNERLGVMKLLKQVEDWSPLLKNDLKLRIGNQASFHIMQEAQRRQPSIIYIPRIDTWWEVAGDPLKTAFTAMLHDIPAFAPVLLFATSHVCYADLPEEIQELFVHEEVFQIQLPTKEERERFLEDLIVNQAAKAPAVKSNAEVLPLFLMVSALASGGSILEPTGIGPI
ncbi:ATPase family AAA domain-containing protein 2-like [Rhynochetos jubatus]